MIKIGLRSKTTWITEILSDAEEPGFGGMDYIKLRNDMIIAIGGAGIGIYEHQKAFEDNEPLTVIEDPDLV